MGVVSRGIFLSCCFLLYRVIAASSSQQQPPQTAEGIDNEGTVMNNNNDGAAGSQVDTVPAKNKPPQPIHTDPFGDDEDEDYGITAMQNGYTPSTTSTGPGSPPSSTTTTISGSSGTSTTIDHTNGIDKIDEDLLDTVLNVVSPMDTLVRLSDTAFVSTLVLNSLSSDAGSVVAITKEIKDLFMLLKRLHTHIKNGIEKKKVLKDVLKKLIDKYINRDIFDNNNPQQQQQNTAPTTGTTSTGTDEIISPESIDTAGTMDNAYTQATALEQQQE